MTSLRSQLIYLTWRYRHLFHLQMKRERWDEHTSIAAFRQRCEEGAKRAGKLPVGIEITPLAIPGLAPDLAAEWIRPAGADDEKVIFYTHGGGYVSGTCSDHLNFVAKVAHQSGVRTLLYEYRLAPEHPYPAALEDTLTAYRWMLGQGIQPANVIIAGESAGGGLCLATLLAIRDQGLGLPAAGVALSPYTDLTLSGESHHANVKVCLSPENMGAVCSRYYYAGNDPRLPYISPLFGDLHGLPPLLIYVGSYETLLDDSTRFAAKAQAAGVDVRLHVEEKMMHCYPLLAPLFPEATRAMNDISAFIRSHLGY